MRRFWSHFFVFIEQYKIVNLNFLYFLIPMFVVFVLIFPIVFEMRLSYNPLFNKGAISLFVLKKRVMCYVFSFHGNYIELENEEETKRKKIEFESEKFAVMEEFGRQMKDKIKLKKGYVYYNIGVGDASQTAMICGLLNFIITQFFVYLKNRKPTASLCVFDTPSYNCQQCEIAILVQISLSFFDVVYSYINSVIITRKK